MDIKIFSTVGYFAEVYFNCSMDWSDLESVIGDFLMREDKQTIEAFQNEVERLKREEIEDLRSRWNDKKCGCGVRYALYFIVVNGASCIIQI